MLGIASELLGSSLDCDETAIHICSLPVPSLADWCSLFIFNKVKAEFEFVRSHHRDKEQNKKIDYYFQNNANEYTKRFIVTNALQQGSAITEIREVPSPIAGFLLNIPLIRRSEVIGFLTLGSNNVFSPQDILIAGEISQRAGIAIDNAMLYQRTRAAELDLIKCAKLADQSNKIKSEFFANMSHEIRTPVTAILGFGDLLAKPNQLDDDRVKWGQRIKYNGNNLLRMINDILNLSKIESGEFQLEKDSIDFSLFLYDLENTYSDQLKLKGLDFKIKLETAIPKRIFTDLTRLNQILTNVIGNAVKLTTQGGIKVDVGYIDTIRMLYFDIEDTGPGLTEAQSALLFRPFVKINPEHSKIEGSTGLGLALSLKLARLLGGDLELIYSKPGIGSQFRISIVPEIDSQTEFIKSYSTKSDYDENINTSSDSSLIGKKILVVDDSIDNRYLIQLLLTNKGALVTAVDNGNEAVNCVNTDDFNIVLMDIQMPGKNGFETAKEMRLNGFAKPIVALTACLAPKEREENYNNDFNDFLTKPIDQNNLIKVLSNLLHI